MRAGPDQRTGRLRTDVILLIALIGVAVWITGDVLLLIFAGILLAVALDGLAAMLVRHAPLRRGWALAVVGVALLALLALLGWTVVPQFLGEVDELWRRMEGLVDQLGATLERHEWISRLLGDGEQGQLADMAGSVVQRVASAGMAALGIAGGLVVFLAIAIFAAADPALYRRGFLSLLPVRYRARTEQALLKAAWGLRWWFLGQLVSMLVLGVSVAVGLMLIGVDLWLSLAVLTALLTFIPFLGPIIAGIPIVIIGFAEGVETGMIVLVFYLVIQNLEGNFLVPMIQHKAVNLAPALLISVQVLMGALFGALGLIMAAPLTVVGMILVNELYVEAMPDEARREA